MGITIIRTDTIIITTEIAITEIFKEVQILTDEEVTWYHRQEGIAIQEQVHLIVVLPMFTEEVDVEPPHHDTIRIQEVLPTQEVLVQQQEVEVMITVEVKEEALIQDLQEEVIAEVIPTTEANQIEVILKAHEVAVVILSQKQTTLIEVL